MTTDKKIVMQCLVFGASGYIGQHVMQHLRALDCVDAVLAVPPHVRMHQSNAILEFIDAELPNVTHIVCAAGRTHTRQVPNIDALEPPSMLDTNLGDNLQGPVMLAMLARTLGAHYTYFGTGCIYDNDDLGDLDHAFSESEAPNYDGSCYSRVKRITDQMLLDVPDVLNLRIRMPIDGTNSERNLITKLSRYARVIDRRNSVSVLPEVLPLAVAMMRACEYGTYNLVNPGTVCHAEILSMYKAYVDPTHAYEPMSVADQNRVLCSRRCNAILDTTATEEAGLRHGITLSHAQDAVRACVAQMGTAVSAYVPRVVMVTGGLGFIGSHVLELLYTKYENYVFVNVDIMSYCSSFANVPGHIAQDSARYTLEIADVRDTSVMRGLMDKHNVDTVLHFAAESHVDNSFANADHFVSVNVMGTCSMLQAVTTCASRCVRRFVHVSTDEVHGPSGPTNTTGAASVTINPTNPYAASKAGAEALVMSYRKIAPHVDFVITRSNNVYGPRQYPEKMIPAFIQCALTGVPCKLHGGGLTSRALVHVADVAAAFDKIVHMGSPNTTYNIGITDENDVWCVRDVAELVWVTAQDEGYIDKMPPDAQRVTVVKDRPFNDQRYDMDVSLMRGLGWYPQRSLWREMAPLFKWYDRALASGHWASS